MNVAELKVKVPECDLYEIREDGKYILVASLDVMPRRIMEGICNELPPDTLIVQVKGNASEAAALIEKSGKIPAQEN